MLNIKGSLDIRCPELAETQRRLVELQTNAVKAIARGFRSWGEQTRTASLRRTPVDTGALRSTVGTATTIQGDRVTVSLHAGGPAGSGGQPPSPGRSPKTGRPAPASVGYAWYVHENLKGGVNWNAGGTGPKFIENPIRENIDKLDREVAAELEREIAKVAR